MNIYYNLIYFLRSFKVCVCVYSLYLVEAYVRIILFLLELNFETFSKDFVPVLRHLTYSIIFKYLTNILRCIHSKNILYLAALYFILNSINNLHKIR